MAMNPAGLDPVKLQVLHPQLALPNLLRCQTSLKSLISGANFRNYVRVTDSPSHYPSSCSETPHTIPRPLLGCSHRSEK